MGALNYKEGILDKLIKHVGLFQSIFGKELQKMITLNERKEHIKFYLKNTLGFDDVYFVFPDELDDDMSKEFTQIMFNYANPSEIANVINTTTPIK